MELVIQRITLSTGIVKNVQESEVETLTVLLLDGRPVRTGAAIYTLNIGLDGEYEDTKADRRKERARTKDKLLIRPIILWMREIVMRVYHLNCGTMYAFGFPLKDNTGGLFKRGHGVIHCLLVDTGDGLALVDTGWGTRDYVDPSLVVRQFANLVGCPYNLDETAIRQVKALGYDPTDVKHIFLTHMHLDHAGGLPDFPAATVHILADELEACLHPRSPMEWYAYRPEHRAHSPKWQPHTLQGNQWFGLDCTPPIRVGGIEFVMIPFAGHTRGHCAVALRMDDRWLMHCGDAYTYYGQVAPVKLAFPSGRLIEIVAMTWFRVPKRHQARIRELLQAHGDEVRAFCAHDAHEFELCAAR